MGVDILPLPAPLTAYDDVLVCGLNVYLIRNRPDKIDLAFEGTQGTTDMKLNRVAAQLRRMIKAAKVIQGEA